MSKERYSLSFEEMTKARAFFQKHADEYITQEFQMRTILSEMGQYPPTSEIAFCLESFDGKLSFNNFCNYLSYLKKNFSRPEPKDVDTVRAFIALGGAGDRSGDISTDDLRSTCQHFHLTIDIDKMIQEVDEDASGTIDFDEFAGMWEHEESGEESDPTPTHPIHEHHKNVMHAEPEPLLDDEENLQVVKGFLFPLSRKPTVPIEAMHRKKSTRKSVIRLPPLGGMRRLSMAEREEAAANEEASTGDGGLKPMPPKHANTARQSNAGFVVPDPTILDFRGRGRKSFAQRKSSAAVTPRPPNSARKPSTVRHPSTARR